MRAIHRAFPMTGKTGTYGTDFLARVGKRTASALCREKMALGLHSSAVMILQSAFSGATMRKAAPNTGFWAAFLRVHKPADSMAEGTRFEPVVRFSLRNLRGHGMLQARRRNGECTQSELLG